MIQNASKQYINSFISTVTVVSEFGGMFLALFFASIHSLSIKLFQCVKLASIDIFLTLKKLGGQFDPHSVAFLKLHFLGRG